jgi:membrane-bound metal-dependent hydrolase YbcI (DUF457 family)
VDIASHLAFGSALSALDRDRRFGPGAGAALVIGSIVPDIDAVVAFVRGMDVYLEQHQTGTHTVFTAAVQAIVVAGGLSTLVAGARFWRLAAAAFVAVLGHFWWDLLSGSTMQLLAPVSAWRLSWPIVAMADPWIVAPLVVAVAVGWWRRHLRYRAAIAALVITTAVVAIHVVARERALAAFEQFAQASTRQAASWQAEPVWGSFDRWRIHARLDSRLGTWMVTAFSGTTPRLMFTPEAPTDAAAVDASRAVPVVKRFLGFADFPFAEVETEGAEHRVLWSDLKFCGPARCDLRFGVALNNGRAPLYEIVWIGELRIVRPLTE